MKKTPIKKISEIAEKKINEPSLSAKDIADSVWVSERTASRVIKEELANIGESSKCVADIIDKNNRLISKAEVWMEEMIDDKDTKVSFRDLVAMHAELFDQNQLVQWKSTENIDYQITIKFDD